MFLELHFKNQFKYFFEGLYSLILPRVCTTCSGRVESVSGFICDKCVERIRRFGGRKIIFEDSAGLGQAVHLYPYRQLNGVDAGNAVRVLKYSGYQALAKEIAEIICDVLEDYPQYFEAVGIVPVPLHPVRKRQRGFNQCDLISQEIAGALEIDYLPILEKRKNTPPQVELSPSERELNVKDVYEVNTESSLSGKSLIIFDDQISTGATIKNAAKALASAGADYVLGLSVTH